MRKRTIHKAAAALTALALCAGVLTGCGGAASSTTASSAAGSAASSEVSGEEAVWHIVYVYIFKLRIVGFYQVLS